jgi:hypothetical protein
LFLLGYSYESFSALFPFTLTRITPFIGQTKGKWNMSKYFLTRESFLNTIQSELGLEELGGSFSLTHIYHSNCTGSALIEEEGKD